MDGVAFCNAAELIRHTSTKWPLEDQAQFERMLRQIMYPIIENFHPTANGNWDASMIQTMIAMGIFLDDRAMFDRAVSYYRNGHGNGAVENYFNEFGAMPRKRSRSDPCANGHGLPGLLPARWHGSKASICIAMPAIVWQRDLSTPPNTISVAMFLMFAIAASRVDMTIPRSQKEPTDDFARSTNGWFIIITTGWVWRWHLAERLPTKNVPRNGTASTCPGGL